MGHLKKNPIVIPSKVAHFLKTLFGLLYRKMLRNLLLDNPRLPNIGM